MPPSTVIKKLIKNKRMEIKTKWAHKLFMNKLKRSCGNELNVKKGIRVGKARENDEGFLCCDFKK